MRSRAIAAPLWQGPPEPGASTTGDTAAISLMATQPEHQRKGMGRALLAQVIADFRRRGVARFHLSATEAGGPLYASLGFETIADLSTWLLPPPAEADG